MHTARRDHDTLLLRSGMVLITGGFGSWPTEVISSVEIFNGQNKTCEEIATLSRPQYLHSVVELNIGKILVAGGVTFKHSVVAGSNLTSTAEILDLERGTCEIIGQLHEAREHAGALPYGKNQAILFGGSSDEYFDVPSDAYVTSCEILRASK